MVVQSNLDYPDLDYPDFFSGPNLVMNIVLFKTTALKSAVKCEGFLLSKSKAALVWVVANEEHSIEF